MSGSVFNVTVERCHFGGAGSDYAGVHLKTRRGRGGAIHSVVLRDCVFDMRTSTKQPFAISAAMFYGSGPQPPTNATATPLVSDVLVERAVILLPAAASRSVFSFVGLPESAMRRFTFRDVRVTAGTTTAAHPWTCQHTDGFRFEGNITPPPGPDCMA